MRKPLLPQLAGYDAKEKGNDYAFTCNLCDDVILVEKRLFEQNLAAMVMMVKDHGCKPKLLILGGTNGTA